MYTVSTILDIDNLHISIPDSYEFDRENENFVENTEHNMYFFTSYESMFNDILNSRGHVFLNEILSALGIQNNQAGQLMGWKKGDLIEFILVDIGDGVFEFSFPSAHYILDVLA